MKFLAVLILIFASVASAKDLFLFGGGKRFQPALAKMMETGKFGTVLVVTWSTTIPDEVFPAIEKDLKQAGAKEVLRSPDAVQTSEERLQFIQQLQASSIVFFSGGDQNRALDVINSQNLRPVLQEAFEQGIVFAGTSAGTALMAEQALTGNEDSPLRPGLGLTPFLTDMHFIVREREKRLLPLVLKTNTIGIGVDEDHCAWIHNDVLMSFGPSETQIFIPQNGVLLKKLRLKDLDSVILN